jgi:hypothetical protein
MIVTKNSTMNMLKAFVLIAMILMYQSTTGQNHISIEQFYNCKIGNISFKEIEATKGNIESLKALFKNDSYEYGNLTYEYDKIVDLLIVHIAPDIEINFSNYPNYEMQLLSVQNKVHSLPISLNGLTISPGDDKSKFRNYMKRVDSMSFSVENSEASIIIMFNSQDKVSEIFQSFMTF